MEKENTVSFAVRVGHFALSTSLAAFIFGFGAGLIWLIDSITGNWGIYHLIIYYSAIASVLGLTLAVWIYTFHSLTGASRNHLTVDRYTPEGEKIFENEKK